MKTLMLTVAMVFAAVATGAAAADEANVPTVTITAKRSNATVLVVERVVPRAAVEIGALLPADLPEAVIDVHVSPIGAVTAQAVEHVRL